MVLIFLFLSLLKGQNNTIFPGFTGAELLDSLVVHYKPQSVLSYADARDTLFSKIYTLDDSLHCVYSDFTIWMDPSQDPNTWAYNNGIDTEHTWPQSKGAVGNAKSDMHHLYATRIQVNSARGSDPFAEVPDTNTDRWFRKTQVLTTIPNTNIDEYSERDDNSALFEPREDHKGNVARAMFYFYTMYKEEANTADPNFFQLQKSELLNWHRKDPADSLESVRTSLIAPYQDNCPNPFILDSSLVRRAYFTDPTEIGSQKNSAVKRFVLYQNYPNPFNPNTVFSFQLAVGNHVTLEIYSLSGQKIYTLLSDFRHAGFHTFEFNASDLASGIYIYRLQAGSEVVIKKMMLLK
ncbi:MAG: endonuclease [bacterium]|nr:MAG: endonuclease [bacterium]